jgi:hypothetical protein
MLKNGRSIGWEEIVPLFKKNSILLVRFIKIGIIFMIFILMMEKVLPKRGGD